ncbi:uncharacterized protein NDAI_0E00260 [Naumovozyma dairenensis CBS 421]|uniref:Endonuclease/exonuclease/phosphatase domain-containing protein n=1 Tax=Naumovozyma dairenensis (strain ATCC 10597 / BCRC 20456 / CBS 421 / NBRC 0211 / NRRL Y-12639) TaxID=1071378 RepID=G0WAS2_NAUDC|nr:hypothetical protein NDAI_0E00260 [Naumovozyma dairenensis CBS 421]CCD24842.1 hypothetical protein NDAI_0E00260 [Naumovozyma dairenensis CBS 421]
MISDSANDNAEPHQTQQNNQKKRNQKMNKKRMMLNTEYITKIRAEREKKRELEREYRMKHGFEPDIPSELQFIKRPLLTLHDDDPVKGTMLKIMTYNCLAQSLIQRDLFPGSGQALKWVRRSKVLLNELKYYDSDLLSLQEIDFVQFKQYWKIVLAKLGYDCEFYKKNGKIHGVLIAWKRNLFAKVKSLPIDFDETLSGTIKPRTRTKNVGLVIALEFLNKDKSAIKKKGVIIGTTHLFWHLFGTFERTRQCYVMMDQMDKFMKKLGGIEKWYPFFTGDFNSQPKDAPYVSITSKPVSFQNETKIVIECSAAYKYSKKRNGEEEEKNEGKEKQHEIDSSDSSDAETDEEKEEIIPNQPSNARPLHFTPTREQAELVSQLAALHNSLNLRAISLYSVGYRKVDPENAYINNDRGEPELSEWARMWSGLLDYIFFLQHWDGKTNHEKVDSLKTFERENNVKLRGLLKMPQSKEMCEHAIPYKGEYPSDHLCMMIQLELLE